MSRSWVHAARVTFVALSLAWVPAALAQWSNDPAANTSVSSAAGRQEPARFVADAFGRTTWVWQDARGGAGDVYAQRLDARGFALWGEHGTSVCDEAHAQGALRLAATGAAVIAVWEDARSDSGDVYAQSLDAGGGPLWTLDGLAACAHAGRQFAPSLVADDSGGVIVAWLDRRDGANAAVYAQRLDPAGARRWAADGVPVCVVPGAHDAPLAITDGAGGAFVVWADARGGYRANRVDREGALLWNADGLPVCTPGTPRNLRAIPDGDGGLLAAWDRTDGTGFFRDIYALRLDGAGAPLWPDTGVVISRATLFQRVPALASDGAGGAIVTWEDNRVFHLGQVFAQRVDAGGATLWAGDGVALCSTNLTRPYPAIAPDGAGGAIVAWQDSRGENVDVYAQRVDADGLPLWTTGGVPVSTAADTQATILVAPDGAGGAFLGWTDGRDPLTRTDVFAAHLLASGALDVASLSAPGPVPGARTTGLALVSRNPAGGFAEFEFVLAHPGAARLEVFDLRGALVRTLASDARSAGTHRARWDMRDDSGRPVANGVYWVSLGANGQREGARCVVLR